MNRRRREKTVKTTSLGTKNRLHPQQLCTPVRLRLVLSHCCHQVLVQNLKLPDLQRCRTAEHVLHQLVDVDPVELDSRAGRGGDEGGSLKGSLGGEGDAPDVVAERSGRGRDRVGEERKLEATAGTGDLLRLRREGAVEGAETTLVLDVPV